jgi:hypothetical protein
VRIQAIPAAEIRAIKDGFETSGRFSGLKRSEKDEGGEG